jgi:hypothetical protein
MGVSRSWLLPGHGDLFIRHLDDQYRQVKDICRVWIGQFGPSGAEIDVVLAQDDSVDCLAHLPRRSIMRGSIPLARIETH